ncbi:MAG: phosphate ABC transporter permease family protein, partial [Desulfobacterales bacterium]
MSPTTLLFILLTLSVFGYYLGRRRAYAVALNVSGIQDLHSRPTYYGALVAIWCGIPALLLFGFWLAFEDSVIIHIITGSLPAELRDLPDDRLNLFINNIKNLVSGNIVSGKVNPEMQAAAEHYRNLKSISSAALAVIVLSFTIAAIAVVRSKIKPMLRARNQVEKAIKYILIACSTIAIFTTIGIVLSVLYEAIRFFQVIPVTEFLFGLEWSPQMAIREDQVGSSGAFGAVPVLVGTALISVIAMAVAVPVGLMSAIYLSEYASKRFR